MPRAPRSLRHSLQRVLYGRGFESISWHEFLRKRGTYRCIDNSNDLVSERKLVVQGDLIETIIRVASISQNTVGVQFILHVPKSARNIFKSSSAASRT